MMPQDFTQLDTLLRSRAQPSVPHGLNARILAAVREERNKRSVWQALSEKIFAPIPFSQPAFALGIFLVVTAGIGVFDVYSLPEATQPERREQIISVADRAPVYGPMPMYGPMQVAQDNDMPDITLEDLAMAQLFGEDAL